ncbi:MAG: hypothetical protein ACLQGP_17780 [Isosphaeraceae bacterium]
MAAPESKAKLSLPSGLADRLKGVIASPLMVSVPVLLALATSLQFGMVWDEGSTVKRDRLLDTWFNRFFDTSSPGQWQRAFDRSDLDRFWPFSREEPNGQ